MLARRDTSPPDGTLATPTIPGERSGASNGAASSTASASN